MFFKKALKWERWVFLRQRANSKGLHLRLSCLHVPNPHQQFAQQYDNIIVQQCPIRNGIYVFRMSTYTQLLIGREWGFTNNTDSTQPACISTDAWHQCYNTDLFVVSYWLRKLINNNVNILNNKVKYELLQPHCTPSLNHYLFNKI